MQKRQAGLATVPILVMVGLLVVGFLGYRLFFSTASSSSGTDVETATKTGCVTQSLTAGATGRCVSDLQSLINVMETGGLTQCPFPQAARLVVSGAYDSATQTQVAAVQSWVNCYNKEEGNAAALPNDGNADAATWSQICVYGYRLPGQAGQSQSPYFAAGQAAGKDAGC